MDSKMRNVAAFAIFIWLVHDKVVWSQSCDSESRQCNCTMPWMKHLVRCYFFSIDENVTRSQAQAKCDNYNAQMGIAKLESINHFIKNNMKSSLAWLGLSDEESENVFVWSNGANASNGFLNWKSGSPKQNGNDFDYVEIERSTGKWNNVRGNKSIGYICRKRVDQATSDKCSESALGMEYTFIPDSNITATSEPQSNYLAKNARLGHDGAWCSSPSPMNEFMEITLSTFYIICAVATQGNFNEGKGFVIEYRLQFYNSENQWEFYKTNITGNENHYQVKKFTLQDAIVAKALRIWPLLWQQSPCMRVEIYGKLPGPPGPPQYLEVFNTSYNYISIKWQPPLDFFDGPKSGYNVKVTIFGDPHAVVRLVYSSCHTRGIDIKDLEEKVAYCVYVTAFNEYGKSNSSSCLPVFTGEKVRVEFTALNQSSTSLEVEWNTTLPAFLTFGDEKRGFKIDFQRAGDTEVNSLLVCNKSSYLFTDLMVFTNYCSSVVSFNNDKIDTKEDNFKCVFTDEEVPGGPPLNLTANNASSTSIFVSWNPIEKELQHGIILGYSIAYKKGNAARRKRRSLSFTDNVVRVENILAWTLVGLEKFTDYCIQIVGFNSKGDGNSSDIVCVRTDEDVPSLPPNITEGFNTSSTSIFINWTQIPPDFIHGYLLGYKMALYPITSSGVYQEAVTIDTGLAELSKDITSLSPYTTYCIRLAGRTRIGPGNWSDCFNVTTDDEVLPLPPMDVKAVSFTSTNTMNVTWSPPPLLYGEITGYKIIFEHQLEDGTWQTREVMTCSTQTTLTGLDINTEYRIKVAASTRKGFSPFSEFAYGETCSCPENVTVIENPSSLDDDHISLSKVIEELVVDVCGTCHAFGRTNLIKVSASEGDVNMNYPVVITSGSFASGKFVAVIEVPGLAVVQRKAFPGGMEKEIAVSVFSSWPVFAISGVMTILAGLVIWVLDVNTNPEEFPPIFYKGAGEGFWWAFITMTTLGYGDRTPKSDKAKFFAIIWFLVGLVVFGLFSAGLTSDLTVVVKTGGTQGSGTSKVIKIATLNDSAEKKVAVRQLMNKFQLSEEFGTLKELVDALKEETTDAILIDMYTPVRRKDLFNGSWFEISEIVDKGISHGITLGGISEKLATDFQEMIRDRNVQTKFLTDDDENHQQEEEEEEESGLVFFEPGSPYFVLTLEICGGLLGGFLLCGCIFEAYQRNRRGNQQTGRQCPDEEEMRKLVEEFYQDFFRLYKRLRKTARVLIKLKRNTQKANSNTYQTIKKMEECGEL